MSVLDLVGDPCSDTSRCVSTIEACRLLDIVPGALRAWYDRFAFPRSCVVDRRRHFLLSDVVALRDALRYGGSIDAAIRDVRDARTAPRERTSHGSAQSLRRAARSSARCCEADDVSLHDEHSVVVG
jgi:hypothetical protein